MDLQTRELAAIQAANLFAASTLFLTSQHIACYLAQAEEFDCAPIIKKIWQASKTCYLPVISSEKDRPLDFVLYQPNTPLHPNRYQILEPEFSEMYPTEKLDLVLVPLVGFDKAGHRLGMGGGYYDRTFSFLTKNVKKPLLVGLAYQCQHIDSLPFDEWDIPLQAVITEHKLIYFQK